MHLIIATQKPTVDVITGLIKGNMPARIAFQVTSRGDSRVVLDEMGADKLLGLGDMLFLIPGTSHIVRAQGTYVSDAEVNRVCQYLERYPVEFSRELVQLQVSGGPGGKDRGAGLKERDELYEPAIEIVIREGRGSCSLLQRALGHRLRPSRPADRLHGRGRHRRRVQERLGPRGSVLLGGLGSPQERRRGRRHRGMNRDDLMESSDLPAISGSPHERRGSSDARQGPRALEDLYETSSAFPCQPDRPPATPINAQVIDPCVRNRDPIELFGSVTLK